MRRESLLIILLMKIVDIYFFHTQSQNSNVIANYRYLKEYITSVDTPNSKISFRSSYLEERSKNSNENISITTDTITIQNITTVDGQKKVQLSRNGLNTDTALQFSDPSLSANLIRIDDYKGELYFEGSTDFPNSFTVSYEHFKFFTGYYSFYGSGKCTL